jgi:tetratricopeptide (TPR) repeat protein
MALRAQRFVELSAVVLCPLLACAIAPLGHKLRGRLPRALQPVLLLLCAAALWRSTRVFPDPFERWVMAGTAPSAATRYLAALDQPFRVLNLETWGGYISLHAPRTRIFIDGRSNTVYDDAFYETYEAMLRGDLPLAQVLAKYRPDAAVLPYTKLVDQLVGLPQPWVVVYRDELAVLLLPPDSPALRSKLPNPEQVLRDEPQWLRHRSGRAEGDGRIKLLEQALRLNPLFAPAYLDLLSLVARDAGPQAAEQIATRVIEQLPQRRHLVLERLGRIYEEHGDAGHALELYRAAVVAGPFDDQQPLLARIVALDENAGSHARNNR